MLRVQRQPSKDKTKSLGNTFCPSSGLGYYDRMACHVFILFFLWEVRIFLLIISILTFLTRQSATSATILFWISIFSQPCDVSEAFLDLVIQASAPWSCPQTTHFVCTMPVCSVFVIMVLDAKVMLMILITQLWLSFPAQLDDISISCKLRHYFMLF